jgi:hypothetical protein
MIYLIHSKNFCKCVASTIIKMEMFSTGKKKEKISLRQASKASSQQKSQSWWCMPLLPEAQVGGW